MITASMLRKVPLLAEVPNTELAVMPDAPRTFTCAPTTG